MTQEEKVIIIQDLQCRLANWLTKFNSSLALDQCAESYNLVNLKATNFIKVLYRYVPFANPVTNADTIELTDNGVEALNPYNVRIFYGSTLLANYTGIGTAFEATTAICDLINSGTFSHGYYCVVIDNVLYLYTYLETAGFADSPVVIYTQFISNPKFSFTYNVSSLQEEDLGFILDKINCLTREEICSIILEAKKLLTNCNCN